MSFSNILFDLDGTLLNTKEGITKAVSQALARFGIEAAPDGLSHFIGPPMRESFHRFYQFEGEKLDQAVAAYREHYFSRGLFEAEPYAGVAEMLAALQAAGRALFVATSKDEKAAARVLEHFGLKSFFTAIGGSDLAVGRASKAQVLRHLMAASALTAGDAVLVGDTAFDVIGAREVGLPCVGILYGFGSREELAAAGADHILENAAELSAWLLG